MARLRYLLPLLATIVIFGHAGLMGFGAKDPGRPLGNGIRGGDLVSFWAGGTLIARGDRANLYTLKRSRPIVKELFPKKPPIYPVGYPPPLYELFALPQPTVSYFDAVRVLLLGMAALQLGVAGILVGTRPELRRWRPEALTALIAFPGFFPTMWAGQLSALWVILLVGGLAMPSPLAGGVILGGLWIKPTLAMPAFAALVLLGEGRRVAGMLLGGLGILLVSLASGGLPEWIGFLHYLQDPGHIVDAYLGHWDREVTLRALVARPFRKTGWEDTAAWVGTAAGWVLLLWTAWLARRRGGDLAVGAVFGVSFYTAAHLLDYDLGMYLPAFVPSAVHLLSGRARFPSLGTASFVLAWLAPAFTLLIPTVHFHLPALVVLLWVGWMIAELRTL